MPRNYPAISIVTPSYNQGMYLEATIKSVIDQSYPDLEYIIIDGGSNDESIDIIKKYSNKLSYWISEPDHGHADALNKGFNQSNGEIMAWINSDDMLTPWSLNCVSQIFTEFPEVEWIQGFTSVWNNQGEMISATRNPKNIYDFLSGNYAWIQQESVFWRRSLWEKAGGFISEKTRYMVDGELWSRFFTHGILYNLDCIIGGYRLHNSNRAAKHINQCITEMHHAISAMERRCDSKTLKNAKDLRRLKTLSQLPISKRVIGSDRALSFLLRTLARGYRDDLKYPLITWDGNASSWKIVHVPYQVH
jgi:glycosyltransferase involved in cell wall biosynthesis